MMRPIRNRRATLTAGAALALAALGLAGCGTPAVIKPASNPLPGFKRDIEAAHSAVRQAERQAEQQDPGATTAP
jgi:hypothetical protein